jgi:hypothetical protein
MRGKAVPLYVSNAVGLGRRQGTETLRSSYLYSTSPVTGSTPDAMLMFWFHIIVFGESTPEVETLQTSRESLPPQMVEFTNWAFGSPWLVIH